MLGNQLAQSFLKQVIPTHPVQAADITADVVATGREDSDKLRCNQVKRDFLFFWNSRVTFKYIKVTVTPCRNMSVPRKAFCFGLRVHFIDSLLSTCLVSRDFRV